MVVRPQQLDECERYNPGVIGEHNTSVAFSTLRGIPSQISIYKHSPTLQNLRTLYAMMICSCVQES